MHPYRSGLPIRLGPVTLIGNLFSAIERNKTSLKTVCPEHKCFVHQQIICDDGDHEVSRATALKGKITTDGLRIFDAGEIPSFERNEVIDLTPVPADSLETQTTNGDSLFYISVKEKVGSEDPWLVFRELASDSKTAYVASVALRTGRKSLYRLIVFNDYLALQQLRFPGNIREHPETPETESTKATVKEFVKLAKQLADNSRKEWNDFDSADDYETRIEAFVSQGELVEIPESAKKKEGTKAAPVAMSTEDMMAQMKVSLED